jgi:hypothetical protein
MVVNDGACSPDNLTATCTCGDTTPIVGRQTCRGGQWDACECVTPEQSSAGMVSTAEDGGGVAGSGPIGVVADPPGNGSANRFEWSRTQYELGACKAGHYIGHFSGSYRSTVVFGFPVDVSDEAGADGAPGLEFWLEKTPGSGEIFSVNGGKLRGTANGEFPFTGDLTGTLDCETKKYVGRIENGQYMVAGVPYAFVGDVTADYDKIQNAFINGMWILTEPATGNPFVGGELEWSAEWSAM